jgi:MFS transporter, DHA2 family, multidrug resistance protein
VSAAASTTERAARPIASHAHPPLTGGALVIGTLALSLATFMNVLDTSIANVSIPAIAGNLGVSPSQGTWVITSFGVANAISLPLTGWLTQRFGQVRIFLASVLLFVIASFLCGLAPNLETLIAFRVMQGFVAGPMIPLSQTLLLSSYAPQRSGMALAFWGITTLVAPVVGPLAGGWITDNIGWPWIFFINVPVGIGTAFATWTLYHRRETPTRKVPIDGIGLALVVLWVGSLQIMLDKGKELDWFASGQIVALAIVAVVGFAFFVAWELTDAHPVVEVARRNFLFATVAIAVAYGLFFGGIILLPLWLQQWMGYTATQAGWALAPVGLLAILLTPVVGRFVNRVDPRPIVTLSFLVFALVMYLRSLFTTDTDLATIMVPTVIQGAGMACFFIPLMSIALSGLAPDRIASASGLTNFARITAGSFGTSISTTLWERRASLHHAQLVEHVTRGNPPTDRFFDSAMRAGLTPEQAVALLNRTVDTQSFTLAADEIFYVSALLFLLLVGLVWLTRPRHGGLSAVADSGAH